MKFELCELEDRTTPSGDFEAAFALGDRVHDLEVVAVGNSYVGGTFFGTVDFDPGPGTFNLTPNGSEDMFVAEYTSAGELVWAKAYGGPNFDFASAVAVDSGGSI